jgi:cholesterol oxidase
MVGCRNNAKNTLVKNYLYFAEKWGAQIRAEAEVTDVRPLPPDEPDQARYEVVYKRSTAWFSHPEQHVRARNVVFSAGALGTMDLLFRCRDVTGSLNKISPTLGDRVRTNSESLLGVSSRDRENNYAEGLAITSIFHADPVTAVEPVHFPAGSSFLRFLAAPILEANGGILKRAFQILGHAIRHPLDFMRTYLAPGWAEYTTILLVMQTEDNHIRMRFERNPLTLFHRGLVSKTDAENQIPTRIEAGHEVARKFAQKTNGIPAGTINEVLLNVPMTAHILGGCPMGNDSSEGVVGIDCQVHNYPGLFVVDGSIMPGNPGINPSLSITALAEYAMSLVPGK